MNAAAQGTEPPRPALCIVLHDVADATLPHCEQLLAAINEVDSVPVTLLAVPRYHGEPPSRLLEQWLDARRQHGDEIALHGFTHHDDGTPRNAWDWLRRRVYTRGEGEFWALDEPEAAARLQAGRAWFARCGWPLHGFVAPAWLMGPAAWRALRAAQTFDYTATLSHLHLLRGTGRLRAQGIVYSTANGWRRSSSVAWAALAARMQQQAPLLRLELHPRDALFPAVRRSWQHLLARALHERRALTMARFAASIQRN